MEPATINENRDETGSVTNNKTPEKIDIPGLRRTILSLAIPSIGEFLLLMSIGIVDLAFVGRLGANATASTGMAWQLIWLLNMVFIGVNRGTLALVARYTGARDKESAQSAAAQSLLISIISSFFISMFILTFAEDLFRILGASPEVMKIGAPYIRILSCAYIFNIMLMCANTSLKGAGDTRTPMLITGLLVILNIFLDYGLIFGKFGLPAHGALGSAEASAMVTALGAFLSVGGLFFGWFRIRVTPDSFARLKWNMIGKILRVGLPVSLEHLFWSGAAAVLLWMVANMGTVPLAVHNILMKAESFSYMPGIGFSIAAGVVVGQALGEGNEKKARVSAWESVKIGMWIMGSMGLLFLLLPRFIVGIFTDQPQVLSIGAYSLMVIAIIQPVQAMLFVLLGAFKGAGDTKATMNISLLGMSLVRVPFAYLLGVTLGFGVTGIWAAVCLDVAFRAYLCYRRFQGDDWMKVKV